jgi:Icc-related predicted phosphoesterase
MRIILFSDPHFGASPQHWSAFFDKRIIGSLNYKFKRHKHYKTERLTQFIELILADKPDMIIFPGDATTATQPKEFEAAKKVLRPLVDSKIPILYVPGNHDCYVRNLACKEALNSFAEFINQNLPFPFQSFPFMTQFMGLEFIGLNTARPTLPTSSCGYVTEEMSRYVAVNCTQEKRYPRILVNHFPLREKIFPVEWRHRLWGQSSLLKLLDEQLIDISICGHRHEQRVDVDESGRGEVCVGSVTKSCIGLEMEYNKRDDKFKYKDIKL